MRPTVTDDELEAALAEFGVFLHPQDVMEETRYLFGLDAQVSQLLTFLKASDKRTVFRLAHIPFLPTALLHGPPGVGKTALVRAVCKREAKPLLEVLPSRIVTSELGRSNQQLERLFTLVKEYSRDRPLVVFFDEIDALARERDDRSELGEMKRLVITFLTQIVYLSQTECQAFIIGATNHVQTLDLAVNRRFLLNIEFSFPSLTTLQAVFDNVANRLRATGAVNVRVQFIDVQEEMSGATGADLERMFQIALINSLGSGKSEITSEEFRHATQFVRRTGLHTRGDSLAARDQSGRKLPPAIKGFHYKE